jgi:hypothetical protein
MKVLGGFVVAMLVVLGLGSAAGASAIAVPIPAVGTVGLISESGGGIYECVGLTLQYDPGGNTNACYINASTPLGQNVDVIVLQVGTNSEPEIVSLNPLGVTGIPLP